MTSPSPALNDPDGPLLSAAVLEIKISPGFDGCRLWIDGLVTRSGLSPSEAMEARLEARRLAIIWAHDALCQLRACLAMAPGRERA